MSKNNIYPNTILQVLGAFLIPCIITYVITMPLFFLLKNNMELVEQIMFILYGILAVGFAYFINKKRNQVITFNLKLNNIALLPLMLVTIMAYNTWFGVPVSKFVANLMGSSPAVLTNPLHVTLYSLSAILLAPILEELIFRGIILKGLLTSYSPAKAIIISALIFGIIHIHPTQIFTAFLFGLFSGWVFYKTKSLGFTILCHFTGNLTATLLAYLNFKCGSSNLYNIYGNMSVYIIIASLVLFVFSLRQLIQKMNNAAELS